MRDDTGGICVGTNPLFYRFIADIQLRMRGDAMALTAASNMVHEII